MSPAENEGTPTTIIGIDCATQAENVGLALGVLQGRKAWIEEVARGSEVDSIKATLKSWTELRPLTLMALDAPLGWPAPMAIALSEHQAGEPLAADLEPGEFFRRQTDLLVEERLGRRPLEVGANWIARTARAALELLKELRLETGEMIPLAWEPPTDPGTYAIEVYPAGTLAAYGKDPTGYKDSSEKEHADRRVGLLDFLEQRVALPCGREAMQANADLLDAALCVLAGVDFLQGTAVAPRAGEMRRARKEGWIWVR